jgi:hypothetical protein
MMGDRVIGLGGDLNMRRGRAEPVIDRLCKMSLLLWKNSIVMFVSIEDRKKRKSSVCEDAGSRR